MGYIGTWMGDRLSSRPAVGCVSVGICLCPQTFVNSSALLVSLLARGPKHLLALLFTNYCYFYYKRVLENPLMEPHISLIKTV